MRNYPNLTVELTAAYIVPLFNILIKTNNNNQFDCEYILTHFSNGSFSDVEMNLTLDDLACLAKELQRLVERNNNGY